MQKIQILFPDPDMQRLRRLAELEDRPISELVRQAVERLLQQKATPPAQPPKFPTFRGGKVLVSADHLKATIYGDGE
jgi:hypothetical protein